jgi:hypothetical protein
LPPDGDAVRSEGNGAEKICSRDGPAAWSGPADSRIRERAAIGLKVCTSHEGRGRSSHGWRRSNELGDVSNERVDASTERVALSTERVDVSTELGERSNELLESATELGETSNELGDRATSSVRLSPTSSERSPGSEALSPVRTGGRYGPSAFPGASNRRSGSCCARRTKAATWLTTSRLALSVSTACRR